MSPVLGLSVMITGMYCLSLFRRWLQLSGGQIISRKVSEGRGSEYPESGAGLSERAGEGDLPAQDLLKPAFLRAYKTTILWKAV